MVGAECINCGLCAQLCPSHLQPQELWRFTRQSQLPPDNLNLPDCLLCSVCDYVCPSDLDLTASFQAAQRLADSLARREQCAQRAQQRYLAREERLQRERERLAQRRKQAWAQAASSAARASNRDRVAIQIQKCQQQLQRLQPNTPVYAQLQSRLQKLRAESG